MDLLFRDANVLDGTGAPAWRAHVGVEADRIVAVTTNEPGPAARTVDATGLALAPGFIDTHGHSDLSPFVEPTMDSAIRQGITTIVVGNCGTSAWPDAGRADAAELSGVRDEDLHVGWASYGGYLEAIDAAVPACNVAALVGHGAVRAEAMGAERRPPSRDELDAMRAFVAEALDAGAVGLSTGLIYPPGMHAGVDELIEIASVVAARGGLYASHVRDEGRRVFDAVGEAIGIGREAGLPAHVSHLKVESSYAWGRAGALLALLDRARAEGTDVSADQYPYTAWETSLSACLPPWAPVEDLRDALTDDTARGRVRAAIERGEPGWTGAVDGLGWDRIAIGSHRPDPSVTGRTVDDLARERGVEPVDLAIELLLADPFTGMIGHGMLEEDVREIVARPDVMVGTDGIAMSAAGPLGAFAVHPRYYGTFPRVLGHYVRDEGVLAVTSAIRKMTSLAADRFRLRDRGRIAEGAFADLVLFDPARVADRATFESPHRFPDGIELVVVNGHIAWDGTRIERAGRVVRRG